ncbi:MAG: NYN domain-containing protein [Fimbriimonadaceae bacterium]|nr:NYN domain-containing protein [Fimbriimonadaceae bacterium]
MRSCALFVDVENIAYFLKPRISSDLIASVCDSVRKLRTHLQSEHDLSCIVQSAYGDFERLESGFLRSFFLMGIETHNVVGTDHKNAADMGLCIEAMRTLYTRTEIDTFVLMAGDRDYIPLVQHLRQSGRSLLVCSFRATTSGDLLNLVEERHFIDTFQFLSDEDQLAVSAYTPPSSEPVVLAPPVPLGQSGDLPQPRKRATKRMLAIDDENTLIALQVLFDDKFKGKREVWLKPYLYELQKPLGHLAEYERKALLGNLEDAGAIEVEKRDGGENYYSVILINWDHPSVQKYFPG